MSATKMYGEFPIRHTRSGRGRGSTSAWLWMLAAALAVAAGSRAARAAEFPITPSDTVVGVLQDYTAQPGDTLADIARHFDVGYTEIVAANPGVDAWSPAGHRLVIPSLYVLPNAPRRGIVLNLGERRLYYFPARSSTVITYPIGIGAIGFNTPLSTTTVVRKEPNPVWIPPPSIREEQPDLPERIGPGPDDPLGDFALRLGWPNYLIHGTNKPDGVGRNVSHGCIHLYPEDIEALFKMVPVGMSVRAIEQGAGAAWIGIGLYVEVHPDKDQADQIDTEQPLVPANLPDLHQIVQAAAGNYADAIDWNAVDDADRDRTGLPVLVAQRPPPGSSPDDTTDAQPSAGQQPASSDVADDFPLGNPPADTAPVTTPARSAKSRNFH